MWQRIGEKAGWIELDKSGLKSDIIQYFKDNPNPNDEGSGGVHEWAEKNGHNKHKVEEAIYELMSTFVEFVVNGRANEKGFKEADADPKELKLGIKIEHEHTTNKETAKRIALDHLAEFEGKKYYSYLKEMEKKIEVDLKQEKPSK